MSLPIRFLLLFVTQFFFAQQSTTTNYTTSDGLPNNAIRSLFIDKGNKLWIGTENGVSNFQNGTFYNLDQSNGLVHNSCWDISQDSKGNMWFASYGGGISTYNGNRFKIFTTKDGLPADKTRKVFPYKDKIYVGTEQGISIIDINTYKINTPKVPKIKEDFICMDFFVYENEVYFIAIFEGLFKIDNSSKIPKVIPVFLNKNNYSLFLKGNNLFLSNEGFIQKLDIKKVVNGDFSFEKFGTSIIWDFVSTKDQSIFAAADGVYNPDGGLYRIFNNEMINVSEKYGIDSKIILNVVYDALRDVLYVGSNDKGIYEIPLHQNIKYQAFSNRNCIDFEEIANTKFILHNKGISLLDSNQNVKKEILLSDFKNYAVNYLKANSKFLITNYRESRDFELNFNIPANGIVFYELVKHKSSIWVASNLGIFELNKFGKIINYIPKHSLKIGFTSDDKFIETITFAGLYLYEDVYKLKGKHYSKYDFSTPQFIVKILNHKNKTYFLSVFNGLYVFEKGKFRSYLYEKIWLEKKFKHIAITNKKQLVLAAEFGCTYSN